MLPVLYPKRLTCLGYILSQSSKCQSPKRSLLSTISYRVVSAWRCLGVLRWRVRDLSDLGGSWGAQCYVQEQWVWQRWSGSVMVSRAALVCSCVCCGRDCTWCNSLSLEVFLFFFFIYDQQLAKDYKMPCKKPQRGYSPASFWCLCEKLSLSLLYFNKTWLHKSSKWSSLVFGSTSKSFPLEAKNPGIVHG